MILKSLKLTNFRRFALLEISLHRQLTVIVAGNGQGKTSLLDAATIALGTFVGAFDHGKAKHIEKSDARVACAPGSSEGVPQFPVEISGVLVIPSGEISVCRELTGPKNKTTIKNAGDLTDYGEQLQREVRDLKQTSLPVIAYYGTGRLWVAHKNMERKSVLSESPTMGYEDCLSSASSFKQLQQWMAKAEYARLQQAEMPDQYGQSNLAARIQAIKNAVDRVLMLQGWSNFHFSLQYEELAMSHLDSGVLPVSMLSDGVRSMVSLVADLAWRCARLNGHWGENAPSESEGIVFIDEVDMHLHPSWQQLVVESLLQAFPKLQFILTTHSPQVLSTVSRENIRLLGKANDGSSVAVAPLAMTYGEPSGDVMQSVMAVDPQPPVPEKADLDRLTELVDQGAYDTAEAKQIFQTLSQALGSEHPQLLRLQRSKQRQLALQA